MKKLLCAMLCAVLTLTFVACDWDGGNSGGGNGGNTPGGDVYVKVIDKGLGSKWIENIASAYYEETGIKVHVSSDPELVSNLLTLMNNPGSEKEDLYFVGHTMNNWIKWIRNGAIESIDDVLSSTKYGTSAKSRVVDKYITDMGTYNDKSYLSSYVYSSWGLIYNQTYLNKIDSFGKYKKGEWPSTVQGLIDLCKAVKSAKIKNTRTGRTVAPFSCGLTVNYMDWLFHGLWYELDPEGYTAYYEYNDVDGGYPTSKLDTPAALQALETIYDLIGATSDTESNLVSSAQNHTESQQSFVNGDCVFTFSGSWFATEMEQILGEVGFSDYHFGAYPVYNAGDKTALAMNLPGETFFVPSDAVNVSGAKDFLAFVLSEKGVATAEKTLQFPMVYTTNEEIEFSAFGQEIVDLAKSSNLIYRFAKTDVFRTGALELFIMGTSPFITMARNKMTKENIRHDVLQTEAVHHQGLWSEWMKRI